MIGDMETGKINCVVVKDLSRFGRDYIETGRYLERIFPALGVRFISVTDQIDSARQAYDLLLPIKNVFNEQYARDISGKIQATIKAKQRAGEFIGAFACYGYKKSPESKNRLVIDEYAASVVRRIFAMYIQGNGKQRIAARLNKEGILCPSEYKRLNGEKYRNGNRLEPASCWTYSTVNAVLHNEIYLGNMVQGKKSQRLGECQRSIPRGEWIRVEDTHQPVIDRATWEMTQRLLAAGGRERRRKTREKGNGEQKGEEEARAEENIFAGLIRCGDCGRAMVRSSWSRRDGSAVCSFYCGTYKRSGKSRCTPHALPLSVIKEALLEDLEKVIRRTEPGSLPASCFFDEGERPELPEHLRARAEAELAKVRVRKKALYEDFREGLVSREEYLFCLEDYRKKEKLYLQQAEKRGEEKRRWAETPEELTALWREKLLGGQGEGLLNRAAVMEMVKEITVYENRRVRIAYRFGPGPEMRRDKEITS